MLLHAERLELAARRGDGWHRLVVAEGGRPPPRASTASARSSATSLRARAAALRGRGHGGEDSDGRPPALGPGTGRHPHGRRERLGRVRGFEPDDLRAAGDGRRRAGDRARARPAAGRAAARCHHRRPHRPAQPARDAPGSSPSCWTAGRPAWCWPRVAVDSFREVNDTLGHEVGDELLLEVTRRLHLSHPHALIGRIGGGRFAVAVPAARGGRRPRDVRPRPAGAGRGQRADRPGRHARPAVRRRRVGARARQRRRHPHPARRDGDVQRPARPGRPGALGAGVRGAGHSDGSPSSRRCARRWPAAPSACTSSPRSRPCPARSPASRRWPAGRTRPSARSGRTSSSRWPRPPA